MGEAAAWIYWNLGGGATELFFGRAVLRRIQGTQSNIFRAQDVMR